MKERKTTMKRYTLLICMLLLLGSSFAQQEYDAWFTQANEAYSAGNYDTAVILYEKVVAADVESVSLYYNLGNAYFKKQEVPMSIYYYEKALKLDPSNEDVKHNLAFANQFIKDKSDPLPQSFIVRGWRNVRSMFSPDQWAWCSVVVFALLLAALFLFLRSRRIGLRKLGFFLGIAFLVVFVFSIIFAVQQKQSAMTQDQAIIMSPEVTVVSSPDKNSVALFLLHEGTKVTVLESSEGWRKIKIANGSVGWLPESSMRAF